MMKMTCPIGKIKNISPKETRQKIDSGSAILLDVRGTKEYSDTHISGAVHIPLKELVFRTGEIPKNREVIIYCRSGKRSLFAALILCALGFRNIANMQGGILAWQ